MTVCPNCLTPLENYTECDGGWCPKCEVWWPSDIIQDWFEENYPEDFDDDNYDYGYI